MLDKRRESTGLRVFCSFTSHLLYLDAMAVVDPLDIAAHLLYLRRKGHQDFLCGDYKPEMFRDHIELQQQLYHCVGVLGFLHREGLEGIPMIGDVDFYAFPVGPISKSVREAVEGGSLVPSERDPIRARVCMVLQYACRVFNATIVFDDDIGEDPGTSPMSRDCHTRGSAWAVTLSRQLIERETLMSRYPTSDHEKNLCAIALDLLT